MEHQNERYQLRVAFVDVGNLNLDALWYKDFDLPTVCVARKDLYKRNINVRSYIAQNPVRSFTHHSLADRVLLWKVVSQAQKKFVHKSTPAHSQVLISYKPYTSEWTVAMIKIFWPRINVGIWYIAQCGTRPIEIVTVLLSWSFDFDQSCVPHYLS